MKLITGLIVASVIYLRTPPPDITSTTGRLTDVKGAVTVTRKGTKVDAVSGYSILVDDRIAIPSGGGVGAMHFRAQSKYALSGPAIYVVKEDKILFAIAKGVGNEARVEKKLKEKAVAKAGDAQTPMARQALQTNARAAGSMLDRPSPFGAVIGTTVTLTWRNRIEPPKNRTAPELTLEMRVEGDTDPIPPVRLPLYATTYEFPKDRLAPGKLYHWKVSVAGFGIGLHSMEGRFFLLDEAEAAEFAAIEKESEALRAASPGSAAGDLLAAAEADRLGLFDKALEYYRAALKLDPSNQSAARRIDELKRGLDRLTD